MELSQTSQLKNTDQKTSERTEEFIIPARVSVFEDKRTDAKTLAMPFQFPDGTNGVVMISRLTKLGWTPSNDVARIVIYFKK